MSATVTDDSFLVRGLRLSPNVIQNPLTYKQEKWSGEKMVLIPSLIDDSLERSVIVRAFAPPSSKNYGVVALTPSFANTKDWEAYKAKVVDKATIDAGVESLRQGNYKETLVIANRYDGIDLPDDTCRVLVFDKKPYAENLADRYDENCRSSSEVTATRVARSIEQGLGRSVRGEKDYCAFVLTGDELVAAVRSPQSRKYLSSQTQMQITVGLEIANFAKEEIEKGTAPLKSLFDLISQCVKRDSGWKEFYIEQMNSVASNTHQTKVLDIFQQELDAELAFNQQNPERAVSIIQRLIDTHVKNDYDKGWYLQEMARYSYEQSRAESNRIQVSAHRKNSFLLKPRQVMTIDKITVISQQRVERIKSWAKQFTAAEEMTIRINDILSRLAFGIRADRFELALHEVGEALGFECQRPDKQWGQGPDNLWGLKPGKYLLFECKSEVDLQRAEINKNESGQMNNSCAWFQREYPDADSANIMIIPTPKCNLAGGFTEDVEIMRSKELSRFNLNIKHFFEQLRTFDLTELSDLGIQELLESNKLSVDSLLSEYSTLAK